MLLGISGTYILFLLFNYSIFFLAAGSMSMRIREGQLVEVFLLRCGNFLFCSCVCCLALYVAFVIKNLLIPVRTQTEKGKKKKKN
jgi:hypothetical protein